MLLVMLWTMLWNTDCGCLLYHFCGKQMQHCS